MRTPNNSKKNTTTSSNNYPMTGVAVPGDNDVVFGRGGASIHHPGNITYRNMVRSHQRQYIGFDETRHMKTLLTHQLVKEWRKQSPPGRFLEKDETTGLWADVGTARARRKTAQLLREGAKKLRNEMRANGELSSSSDSEDDSVCAAPPAKRVRTSITSPSPIVSPEQQPMAFIEFAAANGLGLEDLAGNVTPTTSNTTNNSIITGTMVSPPPSLAVPIAPMTSRRDPLEGLAWETEMVQLSADLRACVRDGRDQLFLHGEPKSSLEMLEHILEPVMSS